MLHVRKARSVGLLIPLFLTLFLLSRVNLATAQQLWGNVQYGMSPNEVSRLVPGSKPIAKGSPNVHGSQSAVEVESYPFAGKTFKVSFLFLSDRLTQVHLADTTYMEANESTRGAFERISNTLRQTYGKEASRRLESRQSGLFGDAEWIQGNTKISVSIIPMTQHHSSIVINYKAK
jgi:hypothetical protein